MIRHVSAMGHMTVQEILDYMDWKHGLVEKTATRMIKMTEKQGIFLSEGNYLVCNNSGFEAWMEIIGMGHPVVNVFCLDCEAMYSSKLSNCPTCGSVDRSTQAPKEEAPLIVVCHKRGCKHEYNSRLPACPECGSVERRIKK